MKVQNPIIGRAKGSAGGMTFCKNYDKNVARAKAFEVSNPKTQAQQTQRAFFAELTALCSDFSDDQLRFLFPSKPKTMSRRNALSKQIAASYAIDGTNKTIDFADIDTLGNAPVSDFGIVEFSIDNNLYYVEFSDFSARNQQLANNFITAVLVNVTKKEILIPLAGIKVSEQEIEDVLPTGWENTDQINAIPLVTDATTQEEFNEGFGTMKVIRRPPHKND